MTKSIFILISLFLSISCARSFEQYDVVIIGGGTSGTAAGIESARCGARTLIVEQSLWLGGMLTSAGVSATDGNYNLRGGIWAEFRDSLEAHYGGPEALKTGWVSYVQFEPNVGNRIFQNIARAEPKLDLWFDSCASAFEQQVDGTWIVSVERGGSSCKVAARVLIDATELGDVAKAVGISYDKGMDSRNVTGESIAPEVANHIIQDITYAVVLKDYKRDVTIEKPKGYDPMLFACCCINNLCVNPKEAHRMWSPDKMITYGKLPNDKYMINWPIEGNDYYVDMVDMTPEQRIEAIERAKEHTLSFVYFLQTELGFNTLSLADDEFPTADRMPFMPYHRESRRIHGAVRFTLNHIVAPYDQPQALYRTAIGVGDYPVDQHHTRYSGWDKLPDLYFYPIPSYGLPLGVMIPKGKRGIIVAEKSVSVTNIVNGSSRLQPVVLQIGQAAGILAAKAAAGNCDVGSIAVREVQQAVLDAGGYLLPLLDLPQSHPHFGAMQRLGVTGIIRFRGANVGWENQLWFDAQKSITESELSRGMSEVYLRVEHKSSDNQVTVPIMAALMSSEAGCEPAAMVSHIKTRWSDLQLTNFDLSRPLTRIECAVVIDDILDPFHNRPIDIEGRYIEFVN